MPTLISEMEFRQRFDIAPAIQSGRITPHIGAASRRLRRWIGEALYQQAVDVAGNESADFDLVADLKNAEAHLTMHFAILGLNSPLTTKGVVATSITGEGQQVTKYLSPKETSDLAKNFLELALLIVEPYIVADTATALIVVTDIDTEASTRAPFDYGYNHHC